MARINFIDFNRLNEKDLEGYRTKVNSNLDLFRQLMYNDPFQIVRLPGLTRTENENQSLTGKISDITGIDGHVIENINTADEMLCSPNLQNFGCTAIGLGNAIGQTMDLYDVDLSIVKEKEALYLTFPPYFTLLGMNRNLSFCTNFLGGPVGSGVPISHLRRDILRHNSLDEVISYLEKTKRASSVNFLVSDGKDIINIESLPERLNISEPEGYGVVHTNHILGNQDKFYCRRLCKATQLLKKGKEIENILDDSEINFPLVGNFGTIVKVIMDVKNQTLNYKEPVEKIYRVVKNE